MKGGDPLFLFSSTLEKFALPTRARVSFRYMNSLIPRQLTCRRGLALAGGLYLLLLILVFGDIFLTGSGLVLSDIGTDTWKLFAHWREFGFRELRHGHLVLWNPYTACGTPFLGAFQTGLLYPVNWIYLFLPLGLALNLDFGVNIWLGGMAMYLWAAHKRMGFWPAWLCGVLFMFCGSFYQNLYAGHLAHLAVITWSPLLFLMVEILLERRSWLWVFPALATFSMMILAGFPQNAFYAALAAGLYVLLRLPSCADKGCAVLRLTAMCAGALGVTAIQWMTTLQASQETIRAGGVSYAFASMFSFPPENFLTLLSPAILGGTGGLPYWGRCYLWEMCLFLSVTGLFLVLVGARLTERKRERTIALLMLTVLFILALGKHTPLFQFLYQHVPGFNLFRSVSKFTFLASLFLILLAGYGLEYLLRQERIKVALVWYPLGGAVVCLLISRWLAAAAVQDYAWWQAVLAWLGRTQEAYLRPELFHHAVFARYAAGGAARALLVTGILLSVIAGVLAWGWRRAGQTRAIAFVMCALATGELVYTAREFRPVFPLHTTQQREVMDYLKQQAPLGDNRILDPLLPDAAMVNGLHGLWGADPSILRRYAEFIFFTQGEIPDDVSEYLPLKTLHPLFGMLRCRYVFLQEPSQPLRVVECAARPLPRLLLIGDWRLVHGRDELFRLMVQPGFDPAQQVLVERAPAWPAVATNRIPSTDKVAVLSETSENIELSVNLDHPAMLVMTDNYSSGWHIVPCSDSSQQGYRLQPADYILRAVSLEPGFHHFRMVYRPLAFVVGVWISAAFLLSLLVLAGSCVWTRHRKRIKATARPAGFD